MKKTSTISKIIEVQNGFVEISHSENKVCCTNDQTFYKFLAKLLIEDKKMLKKNESLPS